MRKALSRLVHSGKPPLCHDVAGWARSHSLEVLELHPAVAPPDQYAAEFPDRPLFREVFQEQFFKEPHGPERLIGLAGARIRGFNGILILPDGTYCTEGQVVESFVTDHPDYTSRMPKPHREISGSVFSLHGLWSEHYYHWFHDVLPRLLLALPHLPGDTRYLLPRNPGSFQIESLEALGIQAGRLLEHDPAEDSAPEVLWFATPLGTTIYTSAEVLAELRTRICAYHRRNFPSRGTGRRIYISRAKTKRRRLLNEPELQDQLQRLGLEIVRTEELGFAEQVDLFANAELVVAPHGAGLTNVLFMNSGSRVIELQDENDPRFCYWRMAKDLGLNYSPIFGPSKGGPRQDADFSVPTDIVVKALVQETNSVK